MVNNPDDILIRKYQPADKAAVRRISCHTALLGKPAAIFLDADNLLADALTLYFTNYEPESSFVAVKDNHVVGYITGAKNVAIMNKIFQTRIMPRILKEATRSFIFLKAKNLRFLFYSSISFLQGEFFMPKFSKDYPATFHTNIDAGYRGLGIGKMLIDCYLDFLQQNKIAGVHCSTVSNQARRFFARQGFRILFQKKRSYWDSYTGKKLVFSIMGKILPS